MADKKNPRWRKALNAVLRYLVRVLSVAIAFYVLFALVFSTEEERQLQRENRLYRQRYARMVEQQRLIGDVVKGLAEKDEDIYRGLFNAGAPAEDPAASPARIVPNDSLPERYYISEAADVSATLMEVAGGVDRDFAEIFLLLQERRDSIPPLSLPLRNITYVQTGAGVGMKYNPVYKLQLMHEGLDLIAPQGAPVYAAAAGTVSGVTLSRNGLGNTVVIDHGNGYVTRYCLLGDTDVSRGMRVRRGQKIATVGINPTLPAPHLHFEVRFHGEVRDPVNYFFASVSAEEYARMLYLSVSTTQSMD